jgi:hypothetical protein
MPSGQVEFLPRGLYPAWCTSLCISLENALKKKAGKITKKKKKKKRNKPKEISGER